MRRLLRHFLALVPLVVPACPVMAQQAPPTTPPVSTSPAQTPPTTPAVVPASAIQTPIPKPVSTVAATVNGQPIAEATVQKMLKRVPVEKQAEVRGEILDHLVENLLLEQYLQQQQVKVEPKEIDAKIDEMKAALKKQNTEFSTLLQEMNLTEPELRELLSADIRWTKFSTAQASDKVVQDLFNGSKEMFDGTQVRVRHLLITPKGVDVKDIDAAKAGLAAVKKEIEQKAAAEVAKLPPATDALTREKFRTKAVEDAFAAAAREKSTCPSKEQGGDVGWFQRVGVMVEPFAKAAFATKAYDITDPVATPFGLHLILVVERKPGRELKFDDVKEEVREVYRERLRQQLVAQLKTTAKIVVSK